MATPKLSASRLIFVSVVLSALAAQAQNLSSLLVATSSPVVDVTERLRTYTSLTDVGIAFGNTGPEYGCAKAWFSQVPQPREIKIGRWAKTATAGKLVCAPLSTANQQLAAWTAITTGSFKVGIDAVAPVDVTGLTFAGAANLNAIAGIIQTAVRAANAAFVAATVIYNAQYQRFEFSSGTTGATSQVTFLAAAATGVNIAGMLGGVSGAGAYTAPGILAESAVAAALIFDSQYGQTFYGMMIPEAVTADQLAVALFIEATNNKHVYGVTSQDASELIGAANTTSIGYQLAQANLNKTVWQYSSTSPYAVASLLGRALTVNYNGNNTVITVMWKQEPGVVAETLNDQQMANVEANYGNVFVAYNNNTTIIEQGRMASGEFIDTITGADAFAISVMNDVFNLFYTSPTKIPQTDPGNHLIATTIEAACSRFVTNGYLAPGVWDQSGFGTLEQGDFIAQGFYVYAPPIALQSQAARQARKSVAFQVAAKCAGAIHSADIVLNISR